MPNNKRRVRVQSVKPAARRTGSPDVTAMLLRNGEGAHGNPKAYNRKVKHQNRIDWDA